MKKNLVYMLKIIKRWIFNARRDFIEYKDLISIEELKNLSLIELLTLLNGNLELNNCNSDVVVYDTKDLLEKYPKLFSSKYSIDIAINQENLPFFKMGHKRFFEKKALEEWIDKNNKPLIVIRRKK